jgi:hypothetical protein
VAYRCAVHDCPHEVAHKLAGLCASHYAELAAELRHEVEEIEARPMLPPLRGLEDLATLPARAWAPCVVRLALCAVQPSPELLARAMLDGIHAGRLARARELATMAHPADLVDLAIVAALERDAADGDALELTRKAQSREAWDAFAASLDASGRARVLAAVRKLEELDREPLHS